MSPTRRELLSATLLCGGAAVGCSAAPQQTGSRPTDPQVADLTAERALLATYDATLRAHPTLGPQIRPIRAEHAAHATALQKALGADPTTAAAPTVPAQPTAALQALLAAERTAAVGRSRSCVLADVSRAALLGSIAASEAGHAELLSATKTATAATRPVPMAGQGDVAALQTALAAEYAAAWGYDVVGGQAPSTLQPVVRIVQGNHAATQQLTAEVIRAAHATPVNTQAAYTLPFSVHDTAAAIRLAAYLEEGVAGAWHYVLGQTSGRGVRQLAVAALTADAVQAVRWRRAAGQARTAAFPGG